MRPFGCHVSILNTLDQLEKFDGKLDERIFVGNSTTSKAFRVCNNRTRKVEENLHITFLENKPMIAGGGPEWLFDLDALSKSMNYAPVSAGTKSNDFIGKGASFDAGQSSMETGSSQDYILIPLWKYNSLFDSSSQALDSHNKDKHGPSQASESDNHKRPDAKSSTKTINIAGPINTANYPNYPFMPNLKDVGIFDDAYDNRDEGVEADYNNLETMEPKKVTQALDEEKEVYVSQPLGFVDPEFPDRVYKVEEALYGLHQAPKAWYETLSTYLLDNGFKKGTIDKTLFIKKIKDDILLVQLFVDDIIFGFTKRSLSTEFEQFMHKRFQMSSIRELTFFLGLQVDQQKDGIFLSQDKYTKIHVDYESAVCVVKNLVYHSKTKHIEIRHHFTRDSYEKRLIEMVKIHTDYNVVDLLTKAFDVTRFQFLIANIGLKLKRYLINDGYADLVQYADKKELAIPGQTATDKELLNLLMAGSLPKTTLPTKLYALTVSPTIHTSCIKQFWTSAKVKTINNEVQIQALVDGKRVNIKESSIRCILMLDDAEGTSCLTNAKIFEILARTGIMASAIICLATNQKFNFSRYSLLSLVKNIEADVPFFMFSRFVQLIINHQLGDMTHHKAIFATPLITKKVFANMKMVGTGFSREVTLLFDNMLVQAPNEVGILQADAQPIPIPTEPSTSKPHKKHKPKRKHTKEPEVPPTESPAEHNIPLPSPSHDPLPSGEDSEVLDIKSTYKVKIKKLESKVERLEEEDRVLKEIKGVHSIVDSDEPAYNLDLDHQEKVLSMLDVNDEELADVEEVLEVVKAVKLITKVVTTAGVDVNAASVQDTPITAAKATKVIVPRKRKGVIIQDCWVKSFINPYNLSTASF
nr:uncharacterized mitochondrial protein AtMg00810-like [Tanacetum cinerariifolium]